MAEISGQSQDQPSWVKVDGGAHDQTIEENWLFHLRRERFLSRHSGQVHDYSVIHLADAVHVVALTLDGQVILVRQFRAGSGRDSLEIPGGLVDAGEDPCVAGARELLEETGYAGDPPELLGTLWSVPSLLTSRIMRGTSRAGTRSMVSSSVWSGSGSATCWALRISTVEIREVRIDGTE